MTGQPGTACRAPTVAPTISTLMMARYRKVTSFASFNIFFVLPGFSVNKIRPRCLDVFLSVTFQAHCLESLLTSFRRSARL